MEHDTPEHAHIALENTILRTQVGSGVHGTAIEGQDDRDEMGVCVEPPDFVLGLRGFEQYIYRSANDRPRESPGKDNRSLAGDLDLVIYSLKKWTRLAAAGNPTVLLLLFARDKDLVEITDIGQGIRDNAKWFISKEAGKRFLGYSTAQRERLLGTRGGTHGRRTELIEKYGFDTKFAMHMVRLGLQGVEFLTYGTITLPIPEPDLTWLRELRVGEHSLEDAILRADVLEAQLKALIGSSFIPEQAEHEYINAWLVDSYFDHWYKKGYLE